MNKEEKEMFDKLLKFAEEFQYKIVEVNFKYKNADVVDVAFEQAVLVEYINGKWFDE